MNRRLVVIHTTDSGPSLRGVLVGVHPDALLIEAPEHLDSGERLAGRVAVPRERILFVQNVPAPPIEVATEGAEV